MKRTIEQQKAKRLQENLHLVDFEKQTNRIQFVSTINEVKDSHVSTNFEADTDFFTDNKYKVS